MSERALCVDNRITLRADPHCSLVSLMDPFSGINQVIDCAFS